MIPARSAEHRPALNQGKLVIALYCMSGPFVPLFPHTTAACSHAAALSPIINRFLNKHVRLDLKKLSQTRCWGQPAPSG